MNQGLYKNTTDLMALFDKVEDLHPELVPYLGESGNLPMLRHPLMYSVPHSVELNAMVNARYRVLRDMSAKALSAGDIDKYLCFVERPYRLEYFEKFIAEHKVKPKKYWETLSEVWTDSENIWQHHSTWKNLLFEDCHYARHRHHFMSASERKEFKNLPAIITVYRGINSEHDNKNGFSWTTDFSKAEFFANRYYKQVGEIIKGKVDKKDVLAFLTSRGEAEIVCHFKDVIITY